MERRIFTGADRDLGLEIPRQLAQRGPRLILTGRRTAQATVRALPAEGLTANGSLTYPTAPPIGGMLDPRVGARAEIHRTGHLHVGGKMPIQPAHWPQGLTHRVCRRAPAPRPLLYPVRLPQTKSRPARPGAGG